MIRLSNEDLVNNPGGNSKGNQLKFKKGNIWYKVDCLGYEGLSESICSNILKCSNVENFVIYEPEQIIYDGRTLKGCRSENFIFRNAALITASRLFRTVYNQGVEDYINSTKTNERVKRFISGFSKATNISEAEIGKYLTQIAELDALTLNDDRHFNNIAVIYSEGKFVLSPIFDNGAAFLADQSYHLFHKPQDVQAKPFSVDFTEQKECLEELFGKQVKITIPKINDIFTKDIKAVYPQSIIKPVEQIFLFQAQKYPDIISLKDPYIKNHTNIDMDIYR